MPLAFHAFGVITLDTTLLVPLLVGLTINDKKDDNKKRHRPCGQRNDPERQSDDEIP